MTDFTIISCADATRLVVDALAEFGVAADIAAPVANAIASAEPQGQIDVGGGAPNVGQIMIAIWSDPQSDYLERVAALLHMIAGVVGVCLRRQQVIR